MVNVGRENIGKGGSALTKEGAEAIKNWGERVLATACVEKGLEVYHQVPVGNSIIDFRIRNPKAGGEGALVETTSHRIKHDPPDENDEKWLQRKERQKANMESSGLKNTILDNANLLKIARKRNGHLKKIIS